MKLLHLSDLHIGHGWNELKCMWLVDTLLREYPTVTPNGKTLSLPVIVVTGDITEDGAIHQYQKAREIFSRLRQHGFCIQCCPGNHDYGWKGNWATKATLIRFGNYLMDMLWPDFPIVSSVIDPDLPDHRVIFIAVDSMAGETEGFDRLFAEGEIGEAQRAELAVYLETFLREEGVTVIVFCHHHPFYYNFFLKLKDDQAFKDLLAEKTDILLFGHKHKAYRFPWKEIKYRIPLIYAAGSSVDLGCTHEGKAVFRIAELDTIDMSVTIRQFYPFSIQA